MQGINFCGALKATLLSVPKAIMTEKRYAKRQADSSHEIDSFR